MSQGVAKDRCTLVQMYIQRAQEVLGLSQKVSWCAKAAHIQDLFWAAI